MSPKTEVEGVLVLEPDRLRGAVVAQAVSRAFPTARVYCESTPSRAAELLEQLEIGLFIVAIRGFDLDTITLLRVWAEHHPERTRVLVMTSDFGSTAVSAIKSLPIAGYFDPRVCDLRELTEACRTVLRGSAYRSSAGARCVGEAKDKARSVSALAAPLGAACLEAVDAGSRRRPPARRRIARPRK